MINKEPVTGTKNGDIRYYSWFSPDDNRISIRKVRVIRKWWDPVNSCYVWTCKILECIIGNDETSDGKTRVDHLWQLQETEEDAKRLFFLAIFTHGRKGFYEDEKPW